MANFHRKCLLLFLLCFPMFFEKTVAQTTKVVFNRNHFGKKMLGHLVNALSVNSLTRCVYECLVTAKCLSLNYYQDKTLCELNSEDSMTAPDSLLEYEGNVKYTDISAWPTVIICDMDVWVDWIVCLIDWFVSKNTRIWFDNADLPAKAIIFFLISGYSQKLCRSSLPLGSALLTHTSNKRLSEWW